METERNSEFHLQVSPKHYFDGYDNVKRFISYFYSIDIVLSLKPTNILEVGIGNKTVSNYLKQHGNDITTCDFDRNLKPDYLADIRKLPFKDNDFDVVMVCQVLEHIPFEDLDTALSELHRVSGRFVVVSIPHRRISFEVVLKFPLIEEIFKREFLNVSLGIPFFFKRQEYDGQHYWMAGTKNCSMGKIRSLFNKRFTIIREFRPVLNVKHHFFVLKKR